MKRPYSSESWTRFKTLMQGASKRISLAETRSQLNEDTLKELEPQVTELQEFADSVNDMTTGINLLRGTRDGVLGTTSNKFSEISDRNFYKDGFREYPTNKIATYKDEDGFTVFRLYQSGITNTSNQVQLITSAFLEKEANKEYTLFVDVMIDDSIEIDGYDIGRISQINKDRSTVAENSLVSIDGIEISKFERNKWYTCVAHLTTGTPKDGFSIVYAFFQLPKNGSINFKKAGIYKGSINNPIWSASPFDTLEASSVDLSSINDMTTGINLIRNSRNFKVGSIDRIGESFKDGWRNAQNFTITEEDGFGVASMYVPGTSGYYMYSPYIETHIEKGEICTVSLDYRLNNEITGKANIGYIIVYKKTDNSQVQAISLYSISNPVVGKWNNLVQSFQMDYDIGEEYVVVLAFRVGNNTNISYTKPVFQVGHINHPIWSESPFDVALLSDIPQDVADLTELKKDVQNIEDKIKLLPPENGGTGWEHGLNSGINIVPGTSDEWSGWITPGSGWTNQNFKIHSVPFPEYKNKNDEYTCYIEVEFDNVTVTPSHEKDFRFLIQGTVDGSFDNTNANPAQTLIYIAGFDNFPGNGIHSYKKHSIITLDYYVDTAQQFDIIFRCDYWATGRFRYRCLKIERGHVDYPQWSPAPEDLVTGPINDITTGINLLRGTRDFTEATKLTPGGVPLDGFYFNKSYTSIEKDSDGFSIARIERSGVSDSTYTDIISSIFEVKNGDLITISVDFMINADPETMSNDAIKSILIIQLLSETYSSSTIWYLLEGTKPQDLVAGKWYTLTRQLRINKDTDKWFKSIGRLLGNGNVCFRKFCAYKGHIEHPIWSASPFDLASSYNWNNGVPKLLGKLEVVSTGSADDITKFGSYRVQSTVTGMPHDNDVWVVDVISANGAGSDNYIRQIATGWYSTAIQYTRQKTDGVWSKWRNTYSLETVRPIEGGGTGGATLDDARANLKIDRLIAADPISSVGNDTLNNWKNITPGWYEINNKILCGQPYQWAFLYNQRSGSDITQLLLRRTNQTSSTGTMLSIRSGNVNSTKMPVFRDLYDPFSSPYIPGLYVGQSIAEKFSSEIGTTHIATWLSNRVKAGNFEGLNIGDWVDIACTGETRRYVIADIDPYYNCGSPTRMGHHLVMVPNTRWALSSSRDGAYSVGNEGKYINWNTAANNNGTSTEQSPYLASNLHKWESEVAIKQFPQEWQDAMIDYITYVEVKYSNSSTLTTSTGSKWANLGKLWSLSEVELFGSMIMSSSNAERLSCRFSLFSKMSSAYRNSTFWLRDTADGTDSNAIASYYYGGISSNKTNIDSIHPYPCFLLG